MGENQLLSLGGDLQNQAKPQTWGYQIQEAPKCIILMARCKLLMSRQSPTTLEIQGQGIESSSLRANIRRCTQMGQDVLRSTAEQMGDVHRLAYNMSKTDGIIASILSEIGQKQSEFRHQRLQATISTGVRNVERSVSAITKVKRDFIQWNEATKNLLVALEQKTTDNMRRKRQSEAQLTRLHDEKNKEEQNLRARREATEKLTEVWGDFKGNLRGYGEGFIFKQAETQQSRGPRFSVSITDPGSPVLISGIMALLKTPELISAAYSAGLPGQLDDLQGKIKSLDDKVNEIQNEIESTMDVREVLARTLQDLDELQMQIEHFMAFLINIQRVMADIQDDHKQVLIGNSTTEVLDAYNQDKKLRQDYNRDANDIKQRFLLVSKAASLYNEVSGHFILPGVSWLTGLSFNDVSDNVYNKHELDIQAKELDLCGGARQLITRRIDEIGIELKLADPASVETRMRATVEDAFDDDNMQKY